MTTTMPTAWIAVTVSPSTRYAHSVARAGIADLQDGDGRHRHAGLGPGQQPVADGARQHGQQHEVLPAPGRDLPQLPGDRGDRKEQAARQHGHGRHELRRAQHGAGAAGGSAGSRPTCTWRRRPARCRLACSIPLLGAVKRISATPPSARTPHASDVTRRRSWKSSAASGTTIDRHQAPDELRVGHARLRHGHEEQREVGGEEERARARQPDGPGREPTTAHDGGRPSRSRRPKTSRHVAVVRPGAPIHFTIVEPRDSPSSASDDGQQPDGGPVSGRRRPAARPSTPRSPANGVVVSRWMSGSR